MPSITSQDAFNFTLLAVQGTTLWVAGSLPVPFNAPVPDLGLQTQVVAPHDTHILHVTSFTSDGLPHLPKETPGSIHALHNGH